jgi:hypothetical protein
MAFLIPLPRSVVEITAISIESIEIENDTFASTLIEKKK